MPLTPCSPLLDETLRIVARRYRLPAMEDSSPGPCNASSATTLAMAIEQARRAKVRNEAPDARLKRQFMDALANLIHEAMRADAGDPVFQAMVLHHQAAPVREYAALSEKAKRDSRSIHTAVNAIAHPARLQHTQPGGHGQALAQLHAAVSSGSWSALSDTARRLLLIPDIAKEPPLRRGLARILDSPALGRLKRRQELESDESVRRYQSLWDRYGPRSGSATAHARGSAAQRRGAGVEALAAQALGALARRLDEADGAQASYRAVTSMRVPASICAGAQRAKSEWDAVLLKREQGAAHTAWSVCLLMEVKASVDAAATDLPRLLRGLRLLAGADENTVYPFETRQETVHLDGASLSALATDEAGLARTVLYCCDAPADQAPRLLSAASRMQLLSAQPCLEFAGALAQNRAADPQCLEAVWHLILKAPQWGAVLHQYPTLRLARDLMVHPDDLLAALNQAAGANPDTGPAPQRP